MASQDPARPVGNANFRVIIGGVEVAVSSVTGPSSESEQSDERREGVPRLRGVVMRRAVDGSKHLWAWRQAVVEGRRDRRHVVIEHLDESGEHVINAWGLHDAWPTRWSGPSFDSTAQGIATEEVELSFLRLSWDVPPDPDSE